MDAERPSWIPLQVAACRAAHLRYFAPLRSPIPTAERFGIAVGWR